MTLTLDSITPGQLLYFNFNSPARLVVCVLVLSLDVPAYDFDCRDSDGDYYTFITGIVKFVDGSIILKEDFYIHRSVWTIV